MANDITLSHVFTLSPEEVREFAELVRYIGSYKGHGIAACFKELAAHSYNSDFKLELSYTIQLPDIDD